MRILERCGMAGCNPCHVPMEACLKMSKRSTQSLVDTTTYQSIIGSLRYLVNTRPDLVFVVGYMSHFLEEPMDYHVTGVKQIIYYVVDSNSWGLWFERKNILHRIQRW
jgi:hypothetical protein